jgi:metal-responsive CopG/Arc/MetJ family transcriptional regulator
MRTAIYLEDELLLQADRTAREMGVSRRLFSIAVEAYLRRRRNREILGRLNRVYAAEPGLKERRAVARMKRRFRSTIRESRPA